MPENEQRPPEQPESKKRISSPGILPEKYPDLHTSKEAAYTVRIAQARGKHIPNDRKERVSVYLDSLHGKHGMLGGSGERRERQIEHHVIKPGEIPEAYFENQRRIAREQGHGDIEITPEMRSQLAEAIIADQTKSLAQWVDYVNLPDANYPTWFRYYTLRSVLSLGQYDKEKHRFANRSRRTTAPFVDLNREALAYVYDSLNKTLDENKREEPQDEELKPLLASRNFGRLYTYAFEKVTPADQNERAQTTGEWIRYAQSHGKDDKEGETRAEEIAQSLQGHGTGWCTAGESTAKLQLEGGDFYIYKTFDKEGKPTVPRIAVRMAQGKVAELRGINPDQNLEGVMVPMAEEKLAQLPGGQEFARKAEDMKQLTRIEKACKNGEALNTEDLRFLYEIDRPIHGFGYEDDPRIAQILSARDTREDGAKIFDCTPDQIALSKTELTEDTRALFGNFNGDFFPHSLRFIKGTAVFADTNTTSLGELRSIGDHAYFQNSQVQGLGKLQKIGDHAYFQNSQVQTLGELRSIGGGADFHNSQVQTLGELRSIGGYADFQNSQVQSLGELRSIGGHADFENSQVQSLGKLQEIGLKAFVANSQIRDLARLRLTPRRADGRPEPAQLSNEIEPGIVWVGEIIAVNP